MDYNLVKDGGCRVSDVPVYLNFSTLLGRGEIWYALNGSLTGCMSPVLLRIVFIAALWHFWQLVLLFWRAEQRTSGIGIQWLHAESMGSKLQRREFPINLYCHYCHNVIDINHCFEGPVNILLLNLVFGPPNNGEAVSGWPCLSTALFLVLQTMSLLYLTFHFLFLLLKTLGKLYLAGSGPLTAVGTFPDGTLVVSSFNSGVYVTKFDPNPDWTNQALVLTSNYWPSFRLMTNQALVLTILTLTIKPCTVEPSLS